MLECEIKLLDINKANVLSTLSRVWAHHEWEELVVDIYLKSQQPKKIRSRIRCTEQNTVLTCKYKLPKTTTKQAYEFDTVLPHEFMIDAHKRSDLVDHVRVKKRITYTRWWYVFDIDQYWWVPPILEIEWPDESGIQKVIHLLGRQNYLQSVGGGKAVYSHYDVAHPETTPWFVWRLLSLIRCL